MSRRRLAAVAALAVALGVGACSGGAASPGSSVGPVDLTIYAAASLKSVLASVQAAYGTARPAVTLTIATDSSAALETKIEQGAPADILLSADTANPQQLVDRGLAAGAPVAFATNRLTIIVPAANPASLRSPADLARPGIKIIAAASAVPITKYAEQLIRNLATVPGAPPDFATAYAANVVSREADVAAVVAKIALGEGDAGIVYVTDARSSTSVTSIDVPQASNVVATYAGVVVKASPRVTAARDFLDWLAGPGGRAVLAGFGFQAP